VGRDNRIEIRGGGMVTGRRGQRRVREDNRIEIRGGGRVTRRGGQRRV